MTEPKGKPFACPLVLEKDSTLNLCTLRNTES
jgi:hypothetical protein